MIKLKKIKKTVTYVDAEDDNSSHDAMNTAPHAPKTVTARSGK